MYAISTYLQPAYTEVDFGDTKLGSLQQELPPMFVTISGVARIVSRKMECSASDGLRPYPHWMYHIGEFEQYIDRTIKVFTSLYSHLLKAISQSVSSRDEFVRYSDS